MKVRETVTVERDIHVAPCLECGHTDIQLSDSGYSSFNTGGGKCKKCGHTATAPVSCIPTMADLAAAWNASNDIPMLIRAEEAKIATAERRIAVLKAKAGPVLPLKPLEPGESDDLMPIEDFLRGVASGLLTGFDGNGYWATATHKSDISSMADQPEWATHVLWLNR
jgi:hypothetical protein